MTARHLFILLLLSGFISCNSAHEHPGSKKNPGRKEMAELNKYMVQKDRERILNYIERKGLELTESATGFWYQIRSEGEGNYFRDGDRIIMKYECYLLDGTKCYSSEETGPKDLILGRSEMETGLNQGIRMLKPGGEAIFIIPPYLAYGLVGDGKRIPSRAVIVYNISVEVPVTSGRDL